MPEAQAREVLDVVAFLKPRLSRGKSAQQDVSAFERFGAVYEGTSTATSWLLVAVGILLVPWMELTRVGQQAWSLTQVGRLNGQSWTVVGAFDAEPTTAVSSQISGLREL